MVSCRNLPSTMYVLEDKNCSLITKGIQEPNQWNLVNSSNIASGLQIKYVTGEECLPKKYYQLSLTLLCDKNVQHGTINFQNLNEFDNDKCEKSIIARTSDSCPLVNYYLAWTFLSKYFYVFGPLFIVAGLFAIILGKKLMIGSYFVISYVFLVTAISVILTDRIPGEKIDLLWIVVGGCAVISVGITVLMHRWNLIFYISVGIYTGYVLASLCYNWFFIKMIIVYSVNYF